MFISEWVKNIVGKGENAGPQYILLSLRCFQKNFTFTVVKRLLIFSKGIKLEVKSGLARLENTCKQFSA